MAHGTHHAILTRPDPSESPMMKLSLASVLLVLFAAGCAAPAPPPTPPKPVITSDTVDGLYRGTSTRYQADSRTCPSPGLVTLHVLGGQFTYRWNARIQVPASIQPDGTVQGQYEEITLTGQVILPPQGAATPLRIEGDLNNGICGIHYTVTKRG
jgi:hypothetical protein